MKILVHSWDFVANFWVFGVLFHEKKAKNATFFISRDNGKPKTSFFPGNFPGMNPGLQFLA